MRRRPRRAELRVPFCAYWGCDGKRSGKEFFWNVSTLPRSAVQNSTQALHQLPPQIEQVGAPVGALNGAADRVRENQFGDFARETRLLRRPVAERRTEAVNRRHASVIGA